MQEKQAKMKHLIWFRNNLRVNDNTVLNHAVANNNSVIAVYCFDPRHFTTTAFGFKKTGPYRAQFLIETLKDLKETLKEKNITLVVSLTKPEHCISTLVKNHNISAVYYQKEWTQEEQEVEHLVKESIKTSEVTLHSYYDQFLFHPKDIPFSSINEIPKIYTAFRKACEKKAVVRPLVNSEINLPKTNLLNEDYTIPKLKDLGLSEFTVHPNTAFPYKGGETEGLKRINEYHWNTNHIASYKETRNGMIGSEYSSKYSAWLANGSISARQIYWDIKDYEKKVIKNQSTYWMIFELIWRDYFMYISLKYGNSIFKLNGIISKDYNWNKSKSALKHWINGTTPYDFVNANMIELKETGWMSNRGRQNVASYWAKELQQDWRIGASYFESLLIDYDVHSNYGNWMYNAGVGNDPRDRKFNIQLQAKRYDPNREYRKLWLNDELF